MNDTVEKTNEVVGSTTENTDQPQVDLKDYKLIIDLTKNMKKSLSDARETIYSAFRNENLRIPDVFEDMVIISEEDINNEDTTKLREYLRDHYTEDFDEFQESIGNASDDEVRDKMKDLQKSFYVIHSLEKEYRNILDESKDILEEYFNYINSNKVEDSLKKRLEIMKSLNDLDEVDNKKNQKMISILESALNLSFMKDTFANTDRLVDQFFKDNLSSYVIKKFKVKIKKYGYDENIYRHFFDIEENFLDEKYHPFNNLFLFIYMKFVGYSDPYKDEDGIYVRAITGAVANLIYHRFDSTENEKEFISFISSILDQFIDKGYTETFIMKNISYKNNNENIMARQEQEHQKIELIKAKLDYYEIEYSDDMTLEELSELFDSEYEKLEEERLNENNEEYSDIISDAEQSFKVDRINDAMSNIKDSMKEGTLDERTEDEQDEAVDEHSEESECDGEPDHAE